MIEGLDAGGSALLHSVRPWVPFGTWVSPFVQRRGPLILTLCGSARRASLDLLFWTSCAGLSCKAGGRMRLRVGSGQDSLVFPGCSFP